MKHTLVLNRGKNFQFNTYDLINDFFFQIISVYFIIYFLLPKFFYKHKYFQFFLYGILVCVFSSFLNILVSHYYVNLIIPDANLSIRYIHILSHFVDIFSVSILFVIVILIEYYIRKEQHNKILEKEKLEAELNFLKAQMNPHFLFNALNSIYFLMDSNIELSKDVLLKFSSLLRYQLYDCAVEKSPLKEEINFLNDYIELEKIRNSENLVVSFNKPKNSENYSISPLLLIPFVENAFKYVSHSRNTTNFIKINCAINDAYWLDFSVENTFIMTQEKSNSSGLGIINVKRRLALLYPDKYELEIKEMGTIFKVNLKIDLK